MINQIRKIIGRTMVGIGYGLALFLVLVFGVPFLVGLVVASADLLGFSTQSWAASLAGTVFSVAFDLLGVASPETGGESVFEGNRYALFSAFASLVTIIVLLVTAFIARTEYSLSKVARIKTRTLDQIGKINEDQDIIQNYAQFRYILDKYNGIITFNKVNRSYVRYKEDYKKSREGNFDLKYVQHDFDHILQLLNFYETWAIGVNNDALDANMLRDWWREPYVRHFSSLVGFVHQYRKELNRPEAYEHFEALAKKWASSKEKKLIESNRRAADSDSDRASEVDDFDNVISSAPNVSKLRLPK